MQPLSFFKHSTKFKTITGKTFTTPTAIFLLLAVVVSSCGPKSKNQSTESPSMSNTADQNVVEWYSIPDAGLLSIEKNSDTLRFHLLVGAGENCTGEITGEAVQTDNGHFVFGDSDCKILFKPAANGMIVEESGDLCEHGVHCTFAGDYKKVATEKVVPAKVDFLSWMRNNINSFTCMLEKQYDFKSEKYACGKAVAIEYDPKESTWNEGPEFPKERVKTVHPTIKDIAVMFEHGDLYMLTVTLEEKMILQDVQKIFSLPASFVNYENKAYPNIMSLSFDNYDPSEKLEYSLNPIFVSSFTLIGFEHFGEGDTEHEADQGLIESSVIYEYRETGNVFTLIDEGGPGPYEFTCTNIATIKTSSTLAAQGKTAYTVDNIADFEEGTAWVEGKDGLGEGEWIEFTLTDSYKKWYDDDDFVSKALNGGFVIQTGYAKSPALWKKNSRPSKLKCYYNGKAISTIQLIDSPDFQSFGVFPEGMDEVHLKVGDVFRFEIIEVIKGTSDEDTCISEFHIEGSCG